MKFSDITRRQMLVRSAATAAGLGLSMSILAAQRNKARAEVDPKPDAEKDNDTLNALLKAEYGAIAAYTAGAGLIDADTVTPKDTRDTVKAVAVHFQDQHKQHAAALKKLIEDNDGTPVEDEGDPGLPKSFVDLANKDTTAVMKLAADKERGAAFTYAQVMQDLSTSAAATLVASIGAVESQHFVVLHVLIEGIAAATTSTLDMASLVVPAAFILDVGGKGTQSLENFEALDELLALDARP